MLIALIFVEVYEPQQKTVSLDEECKKHVLVETDKKVIRNDQLTQIADKKNYLKKELNKRIASHCEDRKSWRHGVDAETSQKIILNANSLLNSKNNQVNEKNANVWKERRSRVCPFVQEVKKSEKQIIRNDQQRKKYRHHHSLPPPSHHSHQPHHHHCSHHHHRHPKCRCANKKQETNI